MIVQANLPFQPYYRRPARAGQTAFPFVSPGTGVPVYAQNQEQRQQGGDTPFYAGYTHYIAPAQHPLVMQQVNTAANQWASQWVTDTAIRLPWSELVPTFSEAVRMWLRGAQERLMARRFSPPSLEDWRASAQQAKSAGYEFLRDVRRLPR